MTWRRKKRLYGAGLGAGVLWGRLARPAFRRPPRHQGPCPGHHLARHFPHQGVAHQPWPHGLSRVGFRTGPPLYPRCRPRRFSSYEWSKIYPQFTAAYRVIAPDLVGFGESARPDANLTASDYARSMVEFIRATCDGPVIIVASCLGAGLSVLLASQHPEAVKQLILWMPAGSHDEDVHLGRRFASRAAVLHRFMYRNYESSRAAVRAWLTLQGFADPGKLTEETVEVYATCAQQYGAEHALRNLYAARLNVDLEGRLKTLSQPVTMIWPEGLGDLPAKMQSFSPDSRLLTAPRWSQLAAIEGAEEMAALLAEELDPGPKVVR